MPGRHFASEGYRYGFNGKENDNETVGTGEGTQDYGMRIYNPSLGRFLSVDPLTDDYPELTPYQFASITPIAAADLDGLEADIKIFDNNNVGNDKTPYDRTLFYQKLYGERVFELIAKQLIHAHKLPTDGTFVIYFDKYKKTTNVFYVTLDKNNKPTTTFFSDEEVTASFDESATNAEREQKMQAAFELMVGGFGKGGTNVKSSPKASNILGKKAQFNNIKKDLGIPTSQQPDKVSNIPMTDMNGKSILNAKGKPIMTKEYHFTDAKGNKSVIQDHSAGHEFPDGGSVGPHYNVRPLDPNTGNASRNGTVPGTLPHYSFKKQ